jgi:hypothetical protein
MESYAYLVGAEVDSSPPASDVLISAHPDYSTNHANTNRKSIEKRRLTETNYAPENSELENDGPNKRYKRSPQNTMDVSLPFNNDADRVIVKKEPIQSHDYSLEEKVDLGSGHRLYGSRNSRTSRCPPLPDKTLYLLLALY